jgi:acetolactate synthase-1/2/3 large subunit
MILGMVRQWQELFFDNHYASTEMINLICSYCWGLLYQGKKSYQTRIRCCCCPMLKTSKEAYFLEMVEKENNVFSQWFNRSV